MSSKPQRRKRRKARERLVQAMAKLPGDLTIKATGDVEIAPEVKAGDGETPRPRAFTFAPLYSGGELRVANYQYPVVASVAGIQAAESIPVRRDHDPKKLVGHGTATIEANRVDLTGVMSVPGPEQDTIVAAHSAGFRWQSSITLRPQRGSIKMVPEGKTIKANGRTFSGPLYYIGRSYLPEASFVDIGGDRDAAASIAASANQEPEVMDKELQAWIDEQKDWIKAAGFDADELSEKQAKTLQAMHAAEVKAADDVDGGDDDGAAPNVKAAHKKEMAEAVKEAKEIADICAKYGDPTMEVGEGDAKEEVSIQAHALDNNWDTQRTELQCLRAARPKGPAIHNAKPAIDVEAQAIEVGICRQLGTPDSATIQATGKKYGLEHWYDEKALEASWKPQYSRWTLHQLMDYSIRASGSHFNGNRKSESFIQAFLTAERTIAAAGTGFTSLGVTSILENVANKRISSAFQEQSVVWPQITGRRDLADFKPHALYRLEVGGAYAKIGPDGELKHGKLTDSKGTIQGDTYGMMVSLTRTHQINDDMDAFMQIPAGLGRLAALKIEEAVFVLLLSNPGSHFSVGNNNLISGGGSDLNIAGLTLAEETFGNMVDVNGLPVLVEPDRVLTGTQDSVTARELHDETKVSHQGTSTQTDANPHVGKFMPLKTPYLNNTNIKLMDGGGAITGQDANQWYVFGNPAVLPAIIIGFLNGRMVPVIESAASNFSTLGIDWRSYSDWGVAMSNDKQGAVKAAGA